MLKEIRDKLEDNDRSCKINTLRYYKERRNMEMYDSRVKKVIDALSDVYGEKLDNIIADAGYEGRANQVWYMYWFANNVAQMVDDESGLTFYAITGDTSKINEDYSSIENYDSFWDESLEAIKANVTVEDIKAAAEKTMIEIGNKDEITLIDAFACKAFRIMSGQPSLV